MVLGAMGPFLPHFLVMGGGGEGVCALSKVESSASAPRLPRFIQQGSFSGALLVASILDIVYECHL